MGPSTSSGIATAVAWIRDDRGTHRPALQAPGVKMEASDVALITACRRQDQAAWEMLIARYQRLIYSIPRRAGLDEQQAADVFQHVFATLVKHLDSIEQPERIGAWLVTTARRETWRLGRSQSTAREHATPGDPEGAVMMVPDAGPRPDEHHDRFERRQLVRSAMQELGDPCRTLLLMLFFAPEPPSYLQVAAALGIAEGSIGPTRARCLRKLGKLLEDLDN